MSVIKRSDMGLGNTVDVASTLSIRALYDSDIGYPLYLIEDKNTRKLQPSPGHFRFALTRA